MAWVRLDDRFSEHQKLLALPNDRLRWLFVKALCYSARHETEGRLSAAALDHLGIRRPALDFLQEVGLLDLTEGGWVIHDWVIYNGATVAERVAAYLEGHPEASANEVSKEVGGRREVVLELVRRYHSERYQRGTRSVLTPSPTPQGQDPGPPSTETRVVVDESTEQRGTFKIPDDVLKKVPK